MRTYLAEKPCKRNHQPQLRYVSNGQCVECAALAQRDLHARRARAALAQHPAMRALTVHILDPDHAPLVAAYVDTLNAHATQQRAIAAGATIDERGRIIAPYRGPVAA